MSVRDAFLYSRNLHGLLWNKRHAMPKKRLLSRLRDRLSSLGGKREDRDEEKDK